VAATLSVLNPKGAARAVIDAVTGVGPLQRGIDDPDVAEIWIYQRRAGWWARLAVGALQGNA